MRIGELAKRAGVNIQTIRFYEREQVLRPPTRSTSGYRSYNDQDLEHVIFIKQCQYLGFTLKESKELADLHASLETVRQDEDAHPMELQRILKIAAERLRTIEEKIGSLQEMKERLLPLFVGTETTPAGRCPGQKLRDPK
jgi:MerR family mercuric resistance operon transcriptional regulator